MPPLRLTQEKQRELVGEDLVIGEPLARGFGAGLVVDQAKRSAPGTPALLGQQPRLDPFRQVGSAFERLSHQLANAAVGEPFGQRINRLPDSGLRPLARFAHFGVDDLPFLAIGFELA